MLGVVLSEVLCHIEEPLMGRSEFVSIGLESKWPTTILDNLRIADRGMVPKETEVLMKTIPTHAGLNLQWKRVGKSTPLVYELWGGSDLLARLSWTKESGSLALGESANNVWSFKRIGFFATQVSVRVEGTEDTVAVFSPNWRGDGKVALSDKRVFIWKSTAFWKANYLLTDESGTEVLSIKHNSSISPDRAGVQLGPARLDNATLVLLIMLAMYVGVLAIQDDADSTAMVAVLVACSS